MRHLDGGYANANPTAKAVATGHGVAKYATNFSVSSLTKSGYARARVFFPDAPQLIALCGAFLATAYNSTTNTHTAKALLSFTLLSP